METIKNYYILFLSCIMAMCFATSCSNDMEETIAKSQRYLEIDALVEGATRGAIDGVSFTKGDAIGLFVKDAAGNDYSTDINCSNVKATFDGAKWVINTKIPLDEGRDAVVYAYYPYKSSEIEGNLLNIELSNQDDLMYSGETSVNYESSKANLLFKHALARVTLAIKKAPTDKGKGLLTNIKIANIDSDILLDGQDYVLATSGKMNILTGEVSSSSRGKDDYIGLFKSAVLSETETHMDIFVFPYYKDITRTTIVAVSSPYVNVILTIDGKEYITKIKNPQWYSGKQYVYPITVNRSTDFSNIPAEKVDMGTTTYDGKTIYWASYNLGAASIEDYGGLYGWGDITGQNTSTEISEYPSANPPSDLNITEYNLPAKMWGDGWRYPTNNELWTLKVKCSDPEFVTYNGVRCVKFTSTVTGNVLYFPEAPIRTGENVGAIGNQSYYWLNAINEDDNTMAGTFYFDFNWLNAYPTAGQKRNLGLPVRPVYQE